MEHIDSEDVPFIAAALSQDEALIWSDDKHFQQQNSIVCLTTKEIVKLFHEDSSE
jgi:predicted nucleic acid-binding protein